jgi:CRP-like cAMP-binding protein
MANNVTFKAGEIIFQEGTEAEAFYVIRSGKVRISRGSAVLDDIGSNAFFGEMSLIDNCPRSATATALEYTEGV